MTYEPPEIKIGQQFVMRRVFTLHDDGTKTVAVEMLDNSGFPEMEKYPPEMCNKMPVLFRFTSKKPDVLADVIKEFVWAKQFLNGIPNKNNDSFLPKHTCGKS